VTAQDTAPAVPRPPGWATLLPAGSYAGRSRVLLERSALVSSRAWLVFLSGFFEPVFYLLAMGQGLGSLVGALPGPDGSPISYAAFIAPGLLAASAMNGAVFDSTFNVFFKLKYAKLYDAMLATPLGVVDVALGEIGWALVRGGLYAVGFLLVMAGFGLLAAPWALLALPAALLVALADLGWLGEPQRALGKTDLQGLLRSAAAAAALTCARRGADPPRRTELGPHWPYRPS